MQAKRQDVLVEVFKKMIDSGLRDWRLVLAGASLSEEEKNEFLRKLKKEELVKMLEEIYADKISTTIIEENKPTINDLHPTMKPIKLLSRLIKNSSICTIHYN